MNNIDKFFIESNSPEDFSVKYFSYLNQVLMGINVDEIGVFIRLLLERRESGNTVFFIGNGGSASTSSHFANDISIGTNSYEVPFKVISLVDNISIITAIANDYGYDEIFSRQLEVLASSGDLVVGISASGNSKNVIKAFEYSNRNGIDTFAITAFDGGILKKIATYGIHVPTASKEYGPAEDAHMVLDHLIGAYLGRYIKSKTVNNY